MKVGEFIILEDRLYTKEHEWIKIIDRSVKVGITDYAQKSLHEIVFVGLPEKELLVERRDSISTAESVKAVSEIFAPLSGQIIKVNESLALNPELVNQDPYNQGWIVIIQPRNLEEEKAMLMDAAEYATYLQELITRNKY